MNSDHETLVNEIEKKMAGRELLKSEEEKKQSLFQYNEQQENQFGQSDCSVKEEKKNYSISQTQVSQNLLQIYQFYVNSYIQPRQHYGTFDHVNDRRQTFQPFLLFMKNFKLLKFIFPLEKVKTVFKKFANFGKFLTFDNFVFLINELSHQKQSKNFFKIQHKQSNSNIESLEKMERYELYSYMNLDNPKEYQHKFKNVFEPFNCHNKPSFEKKSNLSLTQDFSYQKFSLPQLRQKAIPTSPKIHTTHKKSLKQETKKGNIFINQKQSNFSKFNKNHSASVIDKKSKKENTVQKNTQKMNSKKKEIREEKEKEKELIISWETLHSKSIGLIQQKSTDFIRKKYFREDDEDKIFLSQYHQEIRKKVEMNLRQSAQFERKNNKAFSIQFDGKDKKRLWEKVK